MGRMSTFSEFVAVILIVATMLAIGATAMSTYRLYQMADNDRQLLCETVSKTSRAYEIVCK